VEKNKQIGKGSFGSVKYIQEIKEGEMNGKFMAVKHQKAVTKSQINNQLQEYDILHDVDTRAALINYQPASMNSKKYEGRDQHGGRSRKASVTIMSLAPGMSLLEFSAWIESEKALGSLPISRIGTLMNVALSVIKEGKQLHDRGILHLDIKPENIHYDPKQNIVTIIDYGTSLRTDSSGTATASL
jgi:serine/threonine protein kinase